MDPSLYHAMYEVEERHWWFVGRRAIIDGFLERAIGPAAGADGSAPPVTSRRILDVGCGTGGMLPLLSRYGQVTGIDSEPLALDYCRKRGFDDVHLQGDFQPRPDWDLATLFDVLEHVDDEAAFLGWMTRSLKPGGRLAITVPAFRFLWSGHDDLNEHRRRYTRRDLVSLLARCGFEVERASYFNTLLFPAALLRLLGRRHAASPAGAGRPGGSHDPDRAREEILRPLRTGPLDGPLGAIFGWERHLLGLFDLPFGVSLFAVARWPGGGPGAGAGRTRLVSPE